MSSWATYNGQLVTNQPCRNKNSTNNMSHYSNSSSYYVNSSFENAPSLSDKAQSSYEDFANNQSSFNRNSAQRLMVNNSTLVATAPEFHPLSQAESAPSNNGAIKKKPQNSRQNYNGRKNNRFGSGRTFNSSRSDQHVRGYEKRKEEQHDVQTEPHAESTGGNFAQEEDCASGLGANTQSNSARSKSGSIKDSGRKYNQYSFKNHQYEYQNDRHSGRSHGNKFDDYTDNADVNSDKQRPQNYPQNQKYNDNSYRNYRGGGRNYERSSNVYEKSYSRSSNYYERNDGDEWYADGVKKRESKTYEKPEGRGNSKYYDGKRQYDRSKDNWRKSSNVSKDAKGHKELNLQLDNKKLDAASQRERLEEMLNRRQLECLVCCEKMKNSDKIWSCKQCYHILHLNCTVAWAKSSKVENGWRCPACQNVLSEVPKKYKCYCGKIVDPKVDPGIIPHGCGDVCLKKGRTCEHKCTILCHPGPCPDCNVMVAKPCGCGATKPIVKCSSDVEIVCESTCSKLLECGIHNCMSRCHSGACNPCDKTILQECYCGKVGRRVECTSKFNGATEYSCEDVCDKLLSCGNHNCEKGCHDGPCGPCSRDVDVIHTCPCGRSPLEKPRTSCLDPIPCCDKICGKILKCGQPSCPHVCKSPCHTGDCPPCTLTTFVRCRCGHMDKELPCEQLTTKADDARCEKKCIKKRLCGKHRCNQRCCIEVEHVCPLPCNHQLSCGQHRCNFTCHSGRCPPCFETSFEELYCECGQSVQYPPIPCGTKPPICNRPCSRQRPCGHAANHSCHTGPCPPCTILCKRYCHGLHEQRCAIPCHQQDFSCGLPCGKKMPCGRHKCKNPCHDGECPLPCKQPCSVPRQFCGHACGKPCHDAPCPESVCKQNVPVTCLCGLQKSYKPCTELIEEFRNIEMAQIKEKFGDLSKDHTVDISDIVCRQRKPSILKILECNDECRVLERNRRLAIGLQIRNPDLSQKLTPRYTDFMRSWAKKDPNFCQKVHDKLTELVQLAKQSKQKSRSYSFESMNRDKRHFIHEYCEHFGCDSAAYDMEPHRNIVATAIKDKSWLPSMSLLEVIQRENGQRKVPGPVFSKSSTTKPETVSLKLPGRSQRPSTPPGEMIDYFDYQP